MADEKIYEWSSDKALSKVKIGNETYKLKDAEARDVIDAEVSRATAAEASLAAAISDEVSRATAAEASLRADLATEVSRATGVEADHDTRIRNLEARGRYLSTWDASTGLPGDYPTIPEGASSPYTYTYKAGDYYIINNVPATGTKYMPDGASITATKSGETWTWSIGKKAYSGTELLVIGGQFLYSTSSWTYVATAKDIAWGNITGNLSDQADLVAEFAKKSKVTVSATGTASDQVKYITIDGVEKKLSDVDKAYVDAELSKKVDKNGTDRLMTADEGTKLAGIASGAQVNVIETVKVGGNALTVSAKAVDIEVQEAGSLALKDVASLADLDASLQATISNKVDKVAGKSLIDDTKIAKLDGIEASAQVNIIEKIRLNGSDIVVGSEKRVDLGDIAVTSAVVANVSYVDADHKLQQTKGSTTTDVHTFGKLADQNSASGTVSIGTVSGVKATGTTTGSIAVVLDQTATAIQSTGSIVATGTVGVTLNNNEASKLKTGGTLPTYSHTGFVGGSKASDTFDQGSLPAIDKTKFSGGSLSAAATAQFASEGLKAHVGASAQSEDIECLYFEDAAKANAVTAQGTLTPAAINDGFFSAGSLPTFSEGAFTPAVYGSDNFTQGAMPTFDAVTVSVASAVFTGSSVNVTVAGSYDKASVNSASTKFTGAAVTLDVGDIVIGDKNVTVQ